MADILTVGKTLKLTPVWKSANSKVATVSRLGVVKAVSPGTVEIYCSIGEVDAVRTIRVEKK